MSAIPQYPRVEKHVPVEENYSSRPPYPRVEKHVPVDEEENVCVICMEGGNVVRPCSCAAVMHRACWTKWKKSSGTNECPFCRQDRGTLVPMQQCVAEFHVGQRVLYRDQVVTVDFVDTMYAPPSYVIRFDDGRTRDTSEDRLQAMAPTIDETPVHEYRAPDVDETPDYRAPTIDETPVHEYRAPDVDVPLEYPTVPEFTTYDTNHGVYVGIPVEQTTTPACRVCGSEHGEMRFHVCGCTDPAAQWAHDHCLEHIIETHGERCHECRKKFKRKTWKKVKAWAKRHKRIIRKIITAGGVVVSVIIIIAAIL